MAAEGGRIADLCAAVTDAVPAATRHVACVADACPDQTLAPDQRGAGPAGGKPPREVVARSSRESNLAGDRSGRPFCGARRPQHSNVRSRWDGSKGWCTCLPAAIYHRSTAKWPKPRTAVFACLASTVRRCHRLSLSHQFERPDGPPRFLHCRPTGYGLGAAALAIATSEAGVVIAGATRLDATGHS